MGYWFLLLLKDCIKVGGGFMSIGDPIIYTRVVVGA